MQITVQIELEQVGRIVGWPARVRAQGLAYAIKITASTSTDFNTAAREMAALISGPCWLVPIHDSTGNTDANTRLSSFIAGYYPGAQVVKAFTRTQPIQKTGTSAAVEPSGYKYAGWLEAGLFF
jgi:hypothetical protein